MQIRLTVLGPRNSGPSGETHASDVLVTAPDGTALGAVSGALAGAVGLRAGARGGRAPTHVHFYAGDQRVDEQAVLGHPPLVEGAVLSVDGPVPVPVAAGPADDPDVRAELHVVGGPDAGGVHLLHPGEVRIGRAADADVPLDDPDVSRLHLLVEVAQNGSCTVTDPGSTNGTTLDGLPVGPEPCPVPPEALVRVGETTLRLTPVQSAPARPPLPGGSVPDGRGHLGLPPRGGERGEHGDPGEWRPAPPPAAAPGTPGTPSPSAPAAPRGATTSGTATPLSGIPRPRPSLHPITPARARRFLARSRDALAGRGPFPPLPTLARRDPDATPTDPRLPAYAAAARLAAEQRGRWPDPAAVLLTALGAGPRLWERGPEHPDALTVRLGSSAECDGPLVGAPAVVDLRAVGSLGLAGPRPRLSGLARVVAAQLATWHGPSALELVLVSADAERSQEARASEWSWLYWLPQLRPAQEQACRLLVGLDADQAVARLGELTARTDADRRGASGPPTVLLLDGDPGSAEAADAVRRLLAAGPAAGVHVVCLAEHPAALPAGLGAIATVTGEVGTLLRIDDPSADHSALGELAVDAVSAEWAERLARALAPLREHTGYGRDGGPRGPLPASARLLDLLGLETVTPTKLSARWAAVPPTADAVTAIVGAARDGLCAIDLADASGMPGGGPHLLIGGDPGSGKTELLRTLTAALAVAEGPDRLDITVVDCRPAGSPAAGGGLRACTELPQVTAHLDAADPARNRLAAEALADELARRERLFGDRGFASWYAEHALALLRGGGDPAPPARVLVVVDDYDRLDPRGQLARALDAIATRGARVGMHLVAATARPDRVAGTPLDEAAPLRIALRLDDPASSRLLLGVDDAAAIPEDRPGRAYVRHPDGGVTAFQAARVSGRIPRTATLRPTVVSVDWAELGAPPTRRPVRELGNGPTDLALLASALQRAAASPANAR